MDTPKYVVGLDKSNGKDEGAITEGYWLNGVFTVTKVHRLTQRALDAAYTCACEDTTTKDTLCPTCHTRATPRQ